MNVFLNLSVRNGYWPPFGVQFLRLELSWRAPVDDAVKNAFVSNLIEGYKAGLCDLGFGFLVGQQCAQLETRGEIRVVLLPFHEFCQDACLFLVRAIHKKLNGATERDQAPAKNTTQETYPLIDKRFFPRKNPKRLAQNLIPRQIPLLPRGKEILQIGWGKNARLMHSSISEQTSQMAISITGDKKMCADILRLHGLPAGNAVPCPNVTVALAAAQRIGFPVVVKPADQERGIGVFALIEDEDRLRAAFASAAKVSKNILIEKHFFGQDYRIQIYNGQAYSVTHRQPASITGNGVDTVEQLLGQLNRDRINHPLLRQIELDDDARHMLKRQNLDLGSVPDNGQAVRLRSIANVDRGGISTQVLPDAHPDNLALAARAAAVVNLDIAGIDILIEDIRRSWKEVGALICEVNARPMINQAALGRLVDMMQPENGYRLPAMLVIAQLPIADLIAALSDLPSGVGVADESGAWVDGIQIHNGRNLTQNGRALLYNRDVRLIIHCTTSGHIQGKDFGGFPCDHYDRLLINLTSADEEVLERAPYGPDKLIDILPTMADDMTQIAGGTLVDPSAAISILRAWAADQVVSS